MKGKMQKLLKDLPTGVAEEMGTLDNDALKEVIVTASATVSQTKSARDKDEKLSGAKEIVKDLGGGYSDVLKAQNAKIAFALHLLNERGDASVEAIEDPAE